MYTAVDIECAAYLYRFKKARDRHRSTYGLRQFALSEYMGLPTDDIRSHTSIGYREILDTQLSHYLTQLLEQPLTAGQMIQTGRNIHHLEYLHLCQTMRNRFELLHLAGNKESTHQCAHRCSRHRSDMIAMRLQGLNGSDMCKAARTATAKDESDIHGRSSETLKERVECIENVHKLKRKKTDVLIRNRVLYI